MNKFSKTVLAAALAVVSVASVSAQKTAHVNLDSLISIMPESKAAQSAVQDYAKQLEDQVTAMQSELKTKYDEYQAKQKDMPEVVRATKEKELNDLNQRIQDFQQQAQQDYQKKNAELSKPIYEKAKKKQLKPLPKKTVISMCWTQAPESFCIASRAMIFCPW